MTPSSCGFLHTLQPETLHQLVERTAELARQARGILQTQGTKAQQRCRSRLRMARRAAQIPHRQLRRKVEDKEAGQKKRYQTLVETTEQMVRASHGGAAARRARHRPEGAASHARSGSSSGGR